MSGKKSDHWKLPRRDICYKLHHIFQSLPGVLCDSVRRVSCLSGSSHCSVPWFDSVCLWVICYLISVWWLAMYRPLPLCSLSCAVSQKSLQIIVCVWKVCCLCFFSAGSFWISIALILFVYSLYIACLYSRQTLANGYTVNSGKLFSRISSLVQPQILPSC